MHLSILHLHQDFVAEVEAPSLQHLEPESSAFVSLRNALEQYPVVITRNQHFTDDQQLRFAERLSGLRGHCAFYRIANVDDSNQLLHVDDFRRLYNLTTRLWHTDGSCNKTPSKYSMLSARVVPQDGGETDFADMRKAYDTLSITMQRLLDPLKAEHSRAYSRHLLSYDGAASISDSLGGTVQQLIHYDARTGRRSLYLSTNAHRILDLPVPDGRLLLGELMEHATNPAFVYRHKWKIGDFVIWDNRLTMHRACRYDDRAFVRDLRRATTPDLVRTSTILV